MKSTAVRGVHFTPKASAFTFYLLFYAAVACLAPFVVLYFQQLGFSGAQIGFLSGLAPLITLVAVPFWTGLADATHRHKLLMSLAIAGAIGAALIYPNLVTFGLIALLVIVFNIFTAPIGPFADSAAMTILEGQQEMYGRLRSGGTLGYGLIAPLAGMLIQSFGIKMAFWSFAALMFGALLVSQRMYAEVSDPTLQSKPAGVSLSGGLRVILADRRWQLFLAMALLCGVGFTAINNYLFSYMQELGASRTTMGLALTLSTLSELPVVFFANRLLPRFGAYRLLVVGSLFFGLRLLLYAVVGSVAGVLLVQLLNGLTMPLIFVAGVSYADANAPAGLKTTAQGLFGAMVFGIGSSVGGLLGGLLLGSLGGRGLYLVIGCLVFSSALIFKWIEKRMPAINR